MGSVNICVAMCALMAVVSSRVLHSSASQLTASEFVVTAPEAARNPAAPLRSVRIRRQVADHGMSPEQIQQVLDLHNHYRSLQPASNMRLMVGQNVTRFTLICDLRQRFSKFKHPCTLTETALQLNYLCIYNL